MTALEAIPLPDDGSRNSCLNPDLFGIDGRARLEQTALAGPYAQRVAWLLKLIDELDAEEALFNGPSRIGLATTPATAPSSSCPGTTLAAVLVAEIGDVHRFASADRLCSCPATGLGGN
ncbi:hypothetical protein [Streptomyces sp. V1I1]|uniref:hypothetical protein n=1 Tax=Streptomyces sp. V1I1 TaxID=3042272 RepID=UPI0027878793|nr:hypothetical protein [Streptomyces sp. V1I1]MDQ0938433.1 hypothetical protein [Streptomyces sp. V1I1]